MSLLQKNSVDAYKDFVARLEQIRLAKDKENQAKMQAFYEQKNGNVLNGPMDGSYIPDGIYDGLTYKWDNLIKRWVHVN